MEILKTIHLYGWVLSFFFFSLTPWGHLKMDRKILADYHGLKRFGVFIILFMGEFIYAVFWPISLPLHIFRNTIFIRAIYSTMGIEIKQE
jgi:hypothetical protein